MGGQSAGADANLVLDGHEHGPIAGNPLLLKVLKKFGPRAFARSSACMEFASFLDRIRAGSKLFRSPARRCLEIGTYHGITAVVLSQYFDEVICISVDDDPSKLLKYDIVEHLGIDNIVFHDVARNRDKRKLIADLEFDFAFSDGDHTNDTEYDFALVERCGRVLFHEFWPLQPAVWNLVNRLPRNEVTRAAHDCFAYWERKER
jgi:hypothetical protein